MKLTRRSGKVKPPTKGPKTSSSKWTASKHQKRFSEHNNEDKNNNLLNNERPMVGNKGFQSTPESKSFAGTDENDIKFTKNETIHMAGVEFRVLFGRTMETENGVDWDNTDEETTAHWWQRQEEDICILWNHVPEEITLNQTASSISYKFVMAVDELCTDAKQEMMDG